MVSAELCWRYNSNIISTDRVLDNAISKVWDTPLPDPDTNYEAQSQGPWISGMGAWKAHSRPWSHALLLSGHM